MATSKQPRAVAAPDVDAQPTQPRDPLPGSYGTGQMDPVPVPDARPTEVEAAIAQATAQGPAPRYPAAPPMLVPNEAVLTRIHQAGRHQDLAVARAQVSAIPTLRAGPVVSQYKAEVLAWIDAMDARGAK